jgi:hypothetical protein
MDGLHLERHLQALLQASWSSMRIMANSAGVLAREGDAIKANYWLRGGCWVAPGA